MLEVNDLIMYGTTGVCRVESIGCPNISGVDQSKLYYVLKPLHRDGTTYTPVDTNTFFRPIITSKATHQLIDQIPSIEPNVNNGNLKVLEDCYKAAIQTHDCVDLIQIIKTVRAKNSIALSNGKKLSQIDQRYMKKAEDLLYGEFSAALDIPKETVKGYIEERVKELELSSK